MCIRDRVVTDHHQVGETLPAAVAVVNPHRKDYPGEFKDLCGAGVALKLCAALDGGDYGQVLESFGALAAVGTVGDIVPLRAENRLLVKKGMEQLPYTENLGLQALMEVSGLKDKPLNAQKIAFGIVPDVYKRQGYGCEFFGAEHGITSLPSIWRFPGFMRIFAGCAKRAQRFAALFSHLPLF